MLRCSGTTICEDVTVISSALELIGFRFGLGLGLGLGLGSGLGSGSE